jgi:beta-glucanase (GH16 family)
MKSNFKSMFSIVFLFFIVTAVYTQTWVMQPDLSDEFDYPVGTSIDLNKWYFQTDAHFNNEQQQYTDWQYNVPSGSHTDNYNLRTTGNSIQIIARRYSHGGYNYTSARINSQCRMAFTYGRIEFRIRPPETTKSGLWPAIWMLGNVIPQSPGCPSAGASLDWPDCGENDIWEYQSSNPNSYITNAYAEASCGICSRADISTGNQAGVWRIYCCEWNENEVSYWYRNDGESFDTVRGKVTKSIGSCNSFRRDMFYLINLAVGGTLGGSINCSFPQTMEIDYIRTYKLGSGQPTVVPTDSPGPTQQLTPPPTPGTLPQTAGRNGDIDGIRLWTLPNGPNDSVIPDQCWHSVGAGPNGDIYISGMDHKENSGVYRLSVNEDILRYVGDARSASEAAGNWQAGETAQKFHNGPTYLGGKMWVATADNTDIDSGYMNTRGFHWYAYDINTGKFSDMSASEPGGVGASHLQLIAVAPDPSNNVLYGMANAAGDIVRYDVSTGRTTNLGRPSSFTQYIYVNRFMWVDSCGTLYFSAGNIDPQWNQGEPVSVYGHLHTYTPGVGFDDSFQLSVATSIEVGQWTKDRKHCYVMDDRGNLYRFDDEGPAWIHLGDIIPAGNGSVWSLQLCPGEDKIYTFWGEGSKQLYEYDINTGQVTTIVNNVSQLSSEVAGQGFITGYDAWDNSGCFYVAAFTMYGGGNVILMRVDPVRVKAAMGIQDITPAPEITPVPTPQPETSGDVDNDGSIDIVDALLTAQYYVGLDPAGFDQSRADVNCDGEISIVDALLIAQYYVGLINQFC